VTLPLFGALCDRTRSRFGRRRVWVLAGVIVYVAGLLLTGFQTWWVAVGLAWATASLGANMAMAGLTAAIADEVPDHQRGAISSAIYGPPRPSSSIHPRVWLVGRKKTGIYSETRLADSHRKYGT